MLGDWAQYSTPLPHPRASSIPPWHGDLHLGMQFCVAHPQSPLEHGLEPWQGVSWRPRMRADWLRSTRETLPRGDTGCGEVGTCQRLGLVPGGAMSEGLIQRSAGERTGHNPKAALPRPQGIAGSGRGCPRPRRLLLLPFLLGNRALPTLSQARHPGSVHGQGPHVSTPPLQSHCCPSPL